MESVLNIIANAENVRMLVIVAIVCSGYVRLNSKMDRRERSLDKKIDELRYNDLAAMGKRIDGVEVSIKELKSYLTSTIEALTYALEKNGTLKQEDKEYVDSRLAH
ncbi:MAG: hypothetical protein LBC75_03440 [Fibromonadaceae bacterium]|jgi:Na+-transporting NADH:ubiquinone oxidoreductase subunit NqrC|nr:hypothetical protein [Fibromonadaceae bacterium]